MIQHIDVTTVRALLAFAGPAAAIMLWIIEKGFDKRLITLWSSAGFLLGGALLLVAALGLCPPVYWVNDVAYVFVLLGIACMILTFFRLIRVARISIPRAIAKFHRGIDQEPEWPV